MTLKKKKKMFKMANFAITFNVFEKVIKAQPGLWPASVRLARIWNGEE